MRTTTDQSERMPCDTCFMVVVLTSVLVQVSRFSGAIHKSFRSLPEARAWLLGVADASVADVTPPYTCKLHSSTLTHQDRLLKSRPDPGAPRASGRLVDSQQEPPTQQGASQIPYPRVKQEETDEWPDEEFFEDAMDVDTTLVNTQQPLPKSQQDAPMYDALSAPTVPAPVAPVPPPLPAQEIQLSPDQQKVLDMVRAGKSVFFTGSAGVYPNTRSSNPAHGVERHGEVGPVA